jgi:hypothetical protein
MLKNKFNHRGTESTEVSWRKVFSLCLCVFALTIFALPAAAQNAAILPVLDPVTIFAEGVEVVETLPVLDYDNDTRVLRYLAPNAAAWEEYNYPAELDEIAPSSDLRSDGTYLISPDYYRSIAAADPSRIWLFDPHTKTIGKPPTICNLVQALPGEGVWRFTKLDGENAYRLCNTETGQISEILPAYMQPYLAPVCSGPPVGGVPETSPDGEWVLFHDCMGMYPEDQRQYNFYAYHVSTGAINFLGQIEDVVTQYTLIERWLDNDSVLIKMDSFIALNWRAIYITDLNNSQSLSRIAQSSEAAFSLPTYLANPPRLLWTAEDFVGNHQAIYEYDVTSRKTKTLLNRFCDLKKTYGQGICSPYAKVVYSNDQVVVLLTGHAQAMYKSLTVYDLQTKQVIFVRDTSAWAEIRSHHNIVLFPYTDTNHQTSLRALTIEGTQISESVLLTPYEGSTYSDTISANDLYLMTPETVPGEQYNRIVNYKIYDFDQQKWHRIFSDRNNHNHIISAEWQPDNTLLVHLWDKEYHLIGSWRIRIDNLFAEGD